MSGKHDDSSDLRLRMYGFDLGWRRGPWEFLGEFISQRFETEDIGTQRIRGYYAQGALDLRDVASWVGLPQDTVFDQLELVVRHGEVDNGMDFRETAFGLIYWIKPSVPLKLAYTLVDEDRNELDNDRFDVQLAYGF